MASSPKTRLRRSAHDISALLKEQSENGYTARAFCVRHGVSKQTYYNWQRKYGVKSPNAFIPFDVTNAAVTEPAPFCEITIAGTASIRFYQPVDAKFIKALNLY